MLRSSLTGALLLACAIVMPVRAQQVEAPDAEADPCSDELRAYAEHSHEGTIAFLDGGNDTADLHSDLGDGRHFLVDGGPDDDRLILHLSERSFLALTRGKRLAELVAYFREETAQDSCAVLDLNPVAGVVVTDFENLQLLVETDAAEVDLTLKLAAITAGGHAVQNLVFLGQHPSPKRDLIFFLTADRAATMRHRGPGDILIEVVPVGPPAGNGSGTPPGSDAVQAGLDAAQDALDRAAGN